VIIPELCSGCLKCVEPCPVDCIYPIEDDSFETPDDWWDAPAEDDPYS
jgi:Na+-translocating ferredoxin:NAD+ oxidoreductase RNF subunit RnfB